MEKYYFIETIIPLVIEDEIDAQAHHNFKSTGIEEFSIDEPRVDEILGDRSYSGGDLPGSVLTEVEGVVKSASNQKKYFFESKVDATRFIDFLNETHDIESKLVIENVKDWNEEWKKSYSTIHVGKQLDIIPSWDKGVYASAADKQVYIYPGMGFGTGSHETTYLCLKLFLNVSENQNTFVDCLDFGCGSGILGIVVKIYDKNSNTDLYDIDKEALENSVQNIELNNLKVEEFKLLLPADREQINKKYNLVFANILQNVLLLEKEYLVNSLHSKGSLILSGLLAGQEVEVIKEYSKLNPGLKHVETVCKGDWVAVLMELD